MFRNLGDPPSDLNYAEQFRFGDDVAARSVRGIIGAMVALMLYVTVVPLVSYASSALMWMLSGSPGEWNSYYEYGRQMYFPAGMLASHLALAALIIVAIAIAATVNGLKPRWICSVQPKFRWRYALICLLFALVVLGIILWIQGIAPLNPGKDFPTWLAVIWLTSPLQAAGEEFLFRGYLLGSVTLVVRNKWLGVLITALIFALFHGTQDLPLFCYRFGFGLLAGALVIMTGGLEAVVAAHVANNLISFTLAAASGSVAKVLATTQIDWATALLPLLGFTICGSGALLLARKLNLATRTP